MAHHEKRATLEIVVAKMAEGSVWPILYEKETDIPLLGDTFFLNGHLEWMMNSSIFLLSDFVIVQGELPAGKTPRLYPKLLAGNQTVTQDDLYVEVSADQEEHAPTVVGVINWVELLQRTNFVHNSDIQLKLLKAVINELHQVNLIDSANTIDHARNQELTLYKLKRRILTALATKKFIEAATAQIVEFPSLPIYSSRQSGTAILERILGKVVEKKSLLERLIESGGIPNVENWTILDFKKYVNLLAQEQMDSISQSPDKQ